MKNTTLLEITHGIKTFERRSRRTTDVQQQQHCVMNSKIEHGHYELLDLERQIVKCTEQLTAVRPEQRQNGKTQ